MTDLISVIVPVYNVEAYIGQCLDSLINQTYRNCEFICINDGSTDQSLQILEGYAKLDNRISIISQHNQGLSAARNRGLQEAHGEYILFLDSDDWIDPATCQAALGFSKKHDLDIVMWSYISEHPNNPIVRHLFDDCEHIWGEAESKQIYRRIVGPYKNELSQPHKVDSCVTAWGKLYKRKIVEDIRFVDTKLIGTEDALFNVYAFSKANRIGYLPTPYSHYRKNNASSLTSCYKRDLPARWSVMYRLIREHLVSCNASNAFYTALSNRICLSMIGIGLNEASSQKSFHQKAIALKAVLQTPLWAEAYQSLPLCYFPLHWKVFFFLSKHQMAHLLLLMVNAIKFLQNKISA